MAHKQVSFVRRCEKKFSMLLTLVDAVRITLGPKSKSVLDPEVFSAHRSSAPPESAIAKEFSLKDAHENLGAQMLRQAAEKAEANAVVDGTSTATGIRARHSG